MNFVPLGKQPDFSNHQALIALGGLVVFLIGIGLTLWIALAGYLLVASLIVLVFAVMIVKKLRLGNFTAHEPSNAPYDLSNANVCWMNTVAKPNADNQLP